MTNPMIEKKIEEFKKDVQRIGWPETEVHRLRQALTDMYEMGKSDGRKVGMAYTAGKEDGAADARRQCACPKCIRELQ